MRLSFRFKIFVTLGAVVCIAIALVLTMAQALALRRFRADFQDRFDRTVTAFRSLQQLRQEFVSDEVTSLTRSNAQFRTILSTASIAGGIAGGGEGDDAALADANLRLNSLVSGLVLHEKSDVFVVVSAAGRLLYSKVAPQQWGSDLSLLPILQAIAEDGRAVAIWQAPVDPAPPARLAPADDFGALYEVVGEAVTFADEWHGTVLTGTRLSRRALEEIRAVSGVDIAAYSHGKLILATLPAGLLAATQSRVSEPRWHAGPAGADEWSLGGRRFLAARADIIPGPARSDPSFVLLQPLDAESQFLRSLRLLLLLAGAGSLAIAVGASYGLASGITRPVATLHRAVQRVARGDLATRVEIRSGDELAELGSSFNDMVAGLRERDLLRRTFDRYVSKGVAAEILRDPTAAQVAGARRQLTLFFIDIGGFTSFSETLPPERVVGHLNQYLAIVCEVILALDGTVSQFQGDGVVAFWGAPLMQPDHALRAARAALRCRGRLNQLQQEWANSGVTVQRFRMGLHSGEVVVGEIGTSERGAYTVIGDAANLASRLEGMNKVYGTDILCSEETVRAAGGAVVARQVDWVRVVGRRAPVTIYELLAEADAAFRCEWLGDYDSALAAYRKREWQAAAEGFDRVLRSRPGDRVAATMAARVESFLRQPPPLDWDGVYDATAK